MAPRTLVFADRGASADAPEHTIAAFELALDQGADGLALDVHLTRDGQPVVIHDFTLERTTDGAGTVAARTMREIKRLDAGAWRGRRFQGQRVQTLQEVLERFRGRARFSIEIRGGPDVYPDIEERVVSTVEIYEAVDRTIILSVDPQALARIRALNGAIELGAIVLESSPESFLAITSPARVLCIPAGRWFESEAEIRGRGFRCYVRSVDDPASIERLSGRNIDGIITARPSPVCARLGR